MKHLLILFILLFSKLAIPQTNDIIPQKKWFLSAAYGVQISGIKDEDFIRKNIAPSVLINAGLWFTPEIALQIGYKGPHFNTIADDEKHHYYFIFGEVLLNVNELVNGAKENKGNWTLIFHPGGGYFYNEYYNRPNICTNIGLINGFKVTNHIDVFIDISAIMGWDIYQGDEDILPSAVLGASYSF